MSSFMISAAPILWLILVILLIVLEVATYQLVAIWFALGAAAALIVSLFELSGTVQSAPKQKTNADRIVGQTAKVIHPITPDQKGRVMVDNLDWAAAAQNRGESFEVGEEVSIVRIEGVTVYVQKL